MSLRQHIERARAVRQRELSFDKEARTVRVVSSPSRAAKIVGVLTHLDLAGITWERGHLIAAGNWQLTVQGRRDGEDHILVVTLKDVRDVANDPQEYGLAATLRHLGLPIREVTIQPT